MADWNEIYAKEQANTPAWYGEQLSRSQEQKQAEIDRLTALREKNNKELVGSHDFANQQAYRGRRMAERSMAQSMAAQGFTGGMKETQNARMWEQYTDKRSAANANYTKGLQKILQDYSDGEMGVNARYNDTVYKLNQRKYEDAQSRARDRYNAQVEQERTAEDRRRWETQMAENQRQWDAQYAFQREQFDYQKSQAEAAAAAAAAAARNKGRGRRR